MPWRIMTAVVVTLVLIAGGGALPVKSQSSSANETPSAWFVELESTPLADLPDDTPSGEKAAYQAGLANQQQAFRQAARAAGVSFTERRAFDTLFNGLSIEVAPAQVATLTRLPGVNAVWPVERFSIPPTTEGGIDPNLSTALAMTGADIAQSELGLTGRGVRVAVMDTGIDYTHPDLGGPGTFPTARVVAGFDFVGDAFTGGNTPVPDPDPMDCNGHGTHVSGIIGARAARAGGATGVAPRVLFGAYRVFGCDGSTTSDIILAAMERALADRMQVLNMSLGAAFTWPQSPSAAASDRLVKRGMVVVASIGNSGANGLYSSGAPGLGSKVIGVASFDNSHISALTFNVSPGGRQVAYLPLATTPAPPTSGTVGPVVFVGRGCLADAYLADPRGRVALIERGLCTFDEKYQRAFTAGATAVLIHNNLPGLFAGGGVTPRTIPGVSISQADGLAIRALPGVVNITWTAVRVNAPNPTGGLISSFSSFGLAPDLALKPDIGAPGGLIRSTFPVRLGSYATISGTSMSSPHVAGGVALFLEALPGTDPESVRDLLMTYAAPKLWFGNPGLGFLENVHRQGAGMLQIDTAILKAERSMVFPGKLSLGEGTGPVTSRLKIFNWEEQDITFDLFHAPALSTGPNTFAVSFFNVFAAATFSASTVVVPSGEMRMVDVTITPPASLPDRSIYGGYIVLRPRQGKLRAPIRVSYAGLKGDYQSIRALVPTPDGIVPCVALLPDPAVCRPLGLTFNPNVQPLFLLFHLDHQVEKLAIDVFSSPNNLSFGKVLLLDFFQRNSARSTFFAFAWDGRDSNGRLVPDGFYTLRLRVLKALGDQSNPAHFESFTTPVVRVLTGL